jgi:UDP-N-acetylmuramate dehydrogenase
MGEATAAENLFQLLEHEPLSAHCRFHVGGPADYFARITSPEALEAALRFAHDHSLRYFVYSGGSNLFFDDNGFRGLVLKLEDGGMDVDPERRLVRVSAGYELSALVRELADQNYGGLEFLANIPGSVGGAIVGNAGCYGRAIAQVLEGAVVFDVAEGKLAGQHPEFFEFAYRHSKLKHDNRWIVVSATLKLQDREGAHVHTEVDDELALRLLKHPHTAWCAGSFFKNPSPEYPAWRAISDAGMERAQVGDARLSPLHANFLVNENAATSAQIIELVRLIQRAVKLKLQLELIPEVRYVGPEGIVELS